MFRIALQPTDPLHVSREVSFLLAWVFARPRLHGVNTATAICALDCANPMETIRSKHVNACIDRLSSLLSAHQPHLQTVLNEAVRVARDTDYELRYTFAAAALRELLREYFVEVASDDDIKLACWYEPLAGARDGVGRRQRIQFAIYGFIHPDELPTDFVADAESLATSLLKAINKLSKYTHLTRGILSAAPAEGDAVVSETLECFVELFEFISHAHDHVKSRLEEEIGAALDALFVWGFFDSIDQLSTHSRPQGASDVEFAIDSITPDEIAFSGNGSVDVDLQYGSDGDCERGDGLELSDSYPFRFSGTTPTTDLRRVKVTEQNVEVDVSSFYE